jgi:hypothetical protein
VADNIFVESVIALAPPILVGLIFWFVMRAIFHADRTERAVYAKIEAEERDRFDGKTAAPAKRP